MDPKSNNIDAHVRRGKTVHGETYRGKTNDAVGSKDVGTVLTSCSSLVVSIFLGKILIKVGLKENRRILYNEYRQHYHKVLLKEEANYCYLITKYWNISNWSSFLCCDHINN